MLEVLPLEIWQLCSSLFILSLLFGSLQQDLEHIKNLWVLSGRQLWSVLLQPIRGMDLLPESPNQRVQTFCGLRRLAVQQLELLGGQRDGVRSRLVGWLALGWWRWIDNGSIVCTLLFQWFFGFFTGLFDGVRIRARASFFKFFQSLLYSLHAWNITKQSQNKSVTIVQSIFSLRHKAGDKLE